jgi:hypothetical protein
LFSFLFNLTSLFMLPCLLKLERLISSLYSHWCIFPCILKINDLVLHIIKDVLKLKAPSQHYILIVLYHKKTS